MARGKPSTTPRGETRRNKLLQRAALPRQHGLHDQEQCEPSHCLRWFVIRGHDRRPHPTNRNVGRPEFLTQKTIWAEALHQLHPAHVLQPPETASATDEPCRRILAKSELAARGEPSTRRPRGKTRRINALQRAPLRRTNNHDHTTPEQHRILRHASSSMITPEIFTQNVETSIAENG